jgi:hypothetical protein
MHLTLYLLETPSNHFSTPMKHTQRCPWWSIMSMYLKNGTYNLEYSYASIYYNLPILNLDPPYFLQRQIVIFSIHLYGSIFKYDPTSLSKSQTLLLSHFLSSFSNKVVVYYGLTKSTMWRLFLVQ